jgi:DNA-binding response OmpR family regulator
VKNVLVVEEEPIVTKVIRLVLERMRHEMITAQSDSEAFERAAHTEQLHLLIFEPLTRGCAKTMVGLLLQIHPAMKVLYISTWPHEALALEGYFHEANAIYLSKPFHFGHLESQVRALLAG